MAATRKIRYNVPDLSSSPGDAETYFTKANKWTAGEHSFSRIGSALIASDVKIKQLEQIFRAAMAIWKREGTVNNKIVVLHGADEVIQDLKAQVKDELVFMFPEVFGKRCRGEEEETFVSERAPLGIAYRAWHTWSRKERKRAARRGNQTDSTGGQQIGLGLGSKSSSAAAMGTVSDASLGDTITVLRRGQGVNLNNQTPQVGYNVLSGNQPSSMPRPVSAPRSSIVEIYSAKDHDELLRLGLQHLSNSDNQSTSTPSFAILESQLREHPLLANWPHKLLFIHVYNKDRNAFVFNQATLDTAFNEWKCKESEAGAFRLYVNDVEGTGRPSKIVTK